MKKIDIQKSESLPPNYRVIINTEENLSIGILLSKAELNDLKTKIEEILDDDN
jgi:hypothetical protein